ncbi:hypothetical protein SDC9_65919 [bioreactor metagenome]|uniref:Uncharacterized protein n=1 Tax=bioreactor metagenome TaxID=1076179 RepID=A0A644XYX9_9ZZZZ
MFWLDLASSMPCASIVGIGVGSTVAVGTAGGGVAAGKTKLPGAQAAESEDINTTARETITATLPLVFFMILSSLFIHNSLLCLCNNLFFHSRAVVMQSQRLYPSDVP